MSETMDTGALLTAYALGELDGAAKLAVEARLLTDAGARATVDEIRATAKALDAAFAAEPAVALLPEQRAALSRRASARSPRRWIVRTGLGLTAAAAVVLVAVTLIPARRWVALSPPSSGPDAPLPMGYAASGGGAGARGGFTEFTSSHDVRVFGTLVEGEAGFGLPDDIFFGSPANPQGGPASAGTDSDTGVSYEYGASAESYSRIQEGPLLKVRGRRALSTFSIDVDTASYANVRRMLNDGQRPPPGAVRVEELVNYFPYAYSPPAGNAPFAVHAEVAACPWRLQHRLVKIGLKAREVERKQRPPMNLVFLLDVSGSMDDPRKLPLVKASMRMLLEELAERDSVAIVTYAGESGVKLPPTSCEKKTEIQAAIDSLVAGGSTNGASGIQLAYDTAGVRFSKEAANRVVLCTDGDFNVGATSHEQLLTLITEKAKTGVFLTVLGYGMGNLKDDTLELLADKGNGGYGYVDSTREAHKILVEQASGTLVTVAKDVKIQVEFNPATVAAYRLVGYENRRLAAKDFKDDTKDAGEIGAGHTVTALYEVVPVGVPVPDEKTQADVEPLKYQPVEGPKPPPAPAGSLSAEMLTVKLRWKEPQGSVSTQMDSALTDAGATYSQASADFKFAAAVASFALLLRGSPNAGTASYDSVAELAGEGLSYDPGGWRKEFLDLVAKAKSLTPPPAPASAPK